jgi:hypothetical protein
MPISARPLFSIRMPLRHPYGLSMAGIVTRMKGRTFSIEKDMRIFPGRGKSMESGEFYPVGVFYPL